MAICMCRKTSKRLNYNVFYVIVFLMTVWQKALHSYYDYYRKKVKLWLN